MRWLLLLWVCVTGVAAANGAGLSPAELKKAQTLDKRKCYRCHKPYDPRDYAAEDWDLWMDKMARKARLKSKDEDLLRRYFDARRRS
jgi:hypothetical protein